MTSSPFVLSIETRPGISYQHGFHLGTDIRLAKQLAVERYSAIVANGQSIVTVALVRDGRLVDCYYGDYWHNDIPVDDNGREIRQ